MIRAESIASVVFDSIREAGSRLRPDFEEALISAAACEEHPRGRLALEQLALNARIASEEDLPLCQDTGVVWVWIELGEDECLIGDLQSAVDEAVADAYREGGLRMSLTRDALFDRANTRDNTPAFIDITRRPGTGATVHTTLKGAGSDNASRVAMLYPASGWEGVKGFVLEVVAKRVTSACPPLIVGVGVGGTFDKAPTLAKRALVRTVGSPAQSDDHASAEAELLEAINASGIGPGGLGGVSTALAVHLVTAPSHIASLPVAVNFGCNAIRGKSVEVSPDA